MLLAHFLPFGVTCTPVLMKCSDSLMNAVDASSIPRLCSNTGFFTPPPPARYKTVYKVKQQEHGTASGLNIT